MNQSKDLTLAPSLSRFCVFAVGDTFGNVGLFRESYSDAGAKSEPLFVYRNTEISYSIESLSYDPSGHLLVATSSKHFVILFYLDKFSFLNKHVRKVSPQDFFRQNHLISQRNQSSGLVTYANIHQTVFNERIPKPVEQPINKTNKPVFYRKGGKSAPKPTPSSSPLPLSAPLKFRGSFLLSSKKSTDLKDKGRPQFISVINLLKPMAPLISDQVFKFEGGTLVYSVGGDNQPRSGRSGQQFMGLSRVSSSGYFDFGSTPSDLQLILADTDTVQWRKRFESTIQAIQANQFFVVVLENDSKLSVFRTKSGRKALFSFESHDLFQVSLSKQNGLLLAKRSGYFSVVDLDSQSVCISANCFELLRETCDSPETLLGSDQVRFLLRGKDSVFLKIQSLLYLYNVKIGQWQHISNTVLFAAFGGQPIRVREFDMPDFPNDPGEILDSTPFDMLRASSNVSKR